MKRLFIALFVSALPIVALAWPPKPPMHHPGGEPATPVVPVEDDFLTQAAADLLYQPLGSGGGGGSTLTNRVGTSTAAGTNKVVTFAAVPNVPLVVCTFSAPIGELAQIEILATTRSNFTYQIRNSAGVVTNGWSINWAAIGR